jgi:DNA ligase (NAD+)
MNIIGLGPAALKDMLKYNIIQDFSDLYDIDRQNMYRHFGAVTANNILNSIEDSRNTDLWRVIHALGIPLIGERASKTLADYYQSMDLLLEEIYDLEESEIEGFGPAMTDSLIVWFIKNNQIVDSLMENGLRPVYVNKMNDSEHAGKSVVITGKLSRGRDEIKEKMEAMGISIKSSVSANTDFLLLGENPGSKFDKAKKFGIRIVDENFFFGG